jgi:hypothetical protein
VVVFALNDREYRRWLEVEALRQRTAAEEAELTGYLDTIAAAENQVQQWVVDYLEAQYEWHCRSHSGAERADLYRAVAPCLPAEWGSRRVARVHGECRHADDTFVGKMLILDEVLRTLQDSGRIETLRDPVGEALFRWSPDPEASLDCEDQEPAPAKRQRPEYPSHSAATLESDLPNFLAGRDRFVGFDE